MVRGEYAAREFNAVDQRSRRPNIRKGTSARQNRRARRQQRRQVDQGVRQRRARGLRQSRDSESGEAAGRAGVHAHRLGRSVRHHGMAGRGRRSFSEDDWRRQWRGSAPIKADLPTREAVRKRLKFGMTIARPISGGAKIGRAMDASFSFAELDWTKAIPTVRTPSAARSELRRVEWVPDIADRGSEAPGPALTIA